MSNFLAYAKDTVGKSTDALAVTVDTKSASLLSLGNASITVPSAYSDWVMIVQYGASAAVWVAVNATAAVPAGNTFATTTSILNPAQIKVKAGDVVNFYNAGGSTIPVSVAMYGV